MNGGIPPSLSKVALYGTGASSCGYCSSTSRSSRISYGIDSQYITPADYQALIDRGWRRSGTYIYLPNNQLSCCPNWTIRLHVPDFKQSRQHRKVKNRFEHYVQFGPSSNQPQPEIGPGSPDPSEISFTETQGYLRCAVDEALRSIGEGSPLEYNIKLSRSEIICNAALVLASRHRKHAKIRIEPRVLAQNLCLHLEKFNLRDGEQVITISSDNNGFLHFRSDSFGRLKMPSIPKFKPRPMSNSSTEPFVNFSARLVPSKFSQEAFDIYRLYQVAVHKDEISRLTERQYRNFLCDSPIIEQQTSDPNIKYGSFHIEYRFDEKLFGVSVVDILPKCVSSVYFFYDPDYAFLSLGIWSALYEVSLIPNSSLLPDLRYYYLGYYVHSCPKMRYKKQFSPAELLCSEKLTWHPLDKCVPALDENKYVAFSTVCEPSSPSDQQTDLKTTLEDIPFMLNGQKLHFRDLKTIARLRLMDMMQEYYEKLGPNLATQRFAVTNVFLSSQ